VFYNRVQAETSSVSQVRTRADRCKLRLAQFTRAQWMTFEGGRKQNYEELASEPGRNVYTTAVIVPRVELINEADP
jgi:hypothetical protein